VETIHEKGLEMKFNPAIADKGKWDLKTEKAVGEDCKRQIGKIAVGYAIAFFDPTATDPEKIWSYSLRTAHSRTHMDVEQAERLKASLQYIVKGIEKIFNVDIEELRKMMNVVDSEYTVRGDLH
jgi:hypothetical protein